MNMKRFVAPVAVGVVAVAEDPYEDNGYIIVDVPSGEAPGRAYVVWLRCLD